MTHRLVVLIATGVCLWSLSGLGTPPSAAADGDQEPKLVVKVYDVSDIQLEVPRPSRKIDDMDGSKPNMSMLNMELSGLIYNPLSGAWHGPGANGSDYLTVPSRNETIGQLQEAIRDLILRDWSIGSGVDPDIKELGDVLAISATEKHHQQIVAFLEMLRKVAAARKMVAIEVHWLWLTEEQLNSMVPPDRGGGRSTIRLIADESAWQKLALERAKEESEIRPGYHAAVTCMNGQTVLAIGGRQTRFISTMIPVVGDETPLPATSQAVSPASEKPRTAAETPSSSKTAMGGNQDIVPSRPAIPPPSATWPQGVGYQPVTTTIQEGAAVQLRPILCEGNQVMLELLARAIEIQKADGGPDVRPSGELQPRASGYRAGEVRELDAAVERPTVLNHRLDTILRLPLGRRVLVGGITRSVEPERGEPNLYVFVEASLFVPKLP